MRRLRGLLAAAGLLTGACRLDLDENLIPGRSAVVDGGAGAPSRSDAQAEASGGGGGGAPSDAGSCRANGDCPAQGCLEGSCVSGRCSYAVCPASSACSVRSCSGGKCGSDTTIGFHAGAWTIGESLGCSGSAERCLAAMGDFVFVGTADGGLVGFRVTNPLAPEPITIENPPFAITALVSNQTRVLLIGPVVGGKLSIAWIDLPTDPMVQRLAPAAAAVNFAGSIGTAYPAAQDGFFLVKNNASEFYPAALLTLPTSAASITQYPSTGIASGAAVVAASGSRLVTYRTEALRNTLAPSFSFENGAGTQNAQNAGEKSLLAQAGEAPADLGAHVFTSGYDGTVLWSTNMLKRPEAGGVFANTVALRWLLVGGTDDFNGTRTIAVESYPDYGIDERRAGPSALIGPQIALVTVADPANVAQTSVRGVVLQGDTPLPGPGAPRAAAADRTDRCRRRSALRLRARAGNDDAAERHAARLRADLRVSQRTSAVPPLAAKLVFQSELAIVVVVPPLSA